eukprot:TRINITY_DN12344_c0_g2_i1.p1 TRINITY_DN12344_c0_g2~~TRINITY_DN12344_c0_g2_i1.p1  ORF type:complete len:319 (-),score=62.18 TRINITY_DN12344_c0_g2_i1:249-1205(-)
MMVEASPTGTDSYWGLYEDFAPTVRFCPQPEVFAAPSHEEGAELVEHERNGAGSEDPLLRQASVAKPCTEACLWETPVVSPRQCCSRASTECPSRRFHAPSSEASPYVNLTDSLPAQEATDDDAYWEAAGWDPESRVYVGAELGHKNHVEAVADRFQTRKNAQPKKTKDLAACDQVREEEIASREDEELAACDQVREEEIASREDEAYWGADGWDPEERVYVGAASGKTHHRTAFTDFRKTCDVSCAKQPSERLFSENAVAEPVHDEDAIETATPRLRGECANEASTSSAVMLTLEKASFKLHRSNSESFNDSYWDAM